MEGFLHVSHSTFPGSPTNSFMADEVASICPLLTPSPPTNALVNPIPVTEESESGFINAQALSSKLHQVQDDNNERCDSASSSSSALAEPACTQLLSGHNPYLHITKDENAAAQETNGKTQTLQMTFRNPPENYFFMTWNWPLIRKVSTWLFLSGLVAMVAIVIAMVWTLPKTCNPPTQWYQGKLMYEIFPASFSDSDGDGIGDFKGINSRLDYIDSLGVKTIRLNSIFHSYHYPEGYKNITSLTKIAPQLGTIQDLNNLISALHERNIFLVLDLPMWPFVKSLITTEVEFTEYNNNDNQSSYELLRISNNKRDPVASAINYWLSFGVDGFYLKGLEHYMEETTTIASCLRYWKKILGPDRLLMINNVVIETTPIGIMNVVLSNVDLVDIHLVIEGGVDKISKQIESVFNGTLFTKASNPWVHWSLSSDNSTRLANKLPFGNATLGATLLQLMLPGTPSIFYGDEIGLKQVLDPHEERKNFQHLLQLAPMVFGILNKAFTRKDILPWLHSQPTSTDIEQFEVVSKMAALRSTSPSIYVNAVRKDGVNKANAEVKYKEDDLLVIQRWYPRRKNYVVVSNMGCVHISADLSTLLYSGEVVVGPTPHSKSESISFKNISLWPGESVIILLD